MLNLSFQGKSAAISLLAVLGTYSYYFYFVLLGAGPGSPQEMLGWMIGMVVLLVVVEVVFHIVIAVAYPAEANAPADEMDRAIRLKAYRLGYLLLSIGVLIVLGRILIGSVMEPEAITVLNTANLLLFVFVLAESGHYGATVYHYLAGV